MEPRALRILYHHRIAASDGMRVHIAELIRALTDQGHVVHIVGPEGNTSRRAGTKSGWLEPTADLVRKILPGAVTEALELLYNIPAYFRLKKEIESFKPDVIYERFNLYLLAGIIYRQRHGLPLLLEINSPLAAERAKFGQLHLKSIAARCESLLWTRSDAALPVTAVLAKDVLAVRNTQKGLHVIPNGANLDLGVSAAAVSAIRQRFNLTPDKLVLGFVGFIRDWHGVGWAIDALTDLPEQTNLLIVGDGPARPSLEARAKELGLQDRVHFAGVVPHQDVAAHIPCFDVALQTASVAYASPLKLFEYMAHARAVVAPDQPNIREVLVNGENALLFEPGDTASFTQALKSLCADQDLRHRLGANALATITDTPLTWAHNAARIANIASELMADAAP